MTLDRASKSDDRTARVPEEGEGLHGHRRVRQERVLVRLDGHVRLVMLERVSDERVPGRDEVRAVVAPDGGHRQA